MRGGRGGGVGGVGGEGVGWAVSGAGMLGAGRGGGTRVVCVDGRSGAGKTSLAMRLAEETGAPVVALEDLYGGWDGLERGIDLLVSAVLTPVAEGRTARVPRYDWTTGAWGAPWLLAPPAVLIVEGVGAGARRAAAYASALVWVEAATATRRNRALVRDGATFAPYWEMWAAQEAALLAREQTPGRADLVIGQDEDSAAAARRVAGWLARRG